MIKKALLILAMAAAVSCSVDKKTPEITDAQLRDVYQELKEIYDNDLSFRVQQPAEGYLKYPYLIPAGFYKQMWDWDGFFMGTYFCTKGHPEHLQWWALNLIEGIDGKGYVSGCATTKGPRPIFGDFSMKPFLSQGVLIASRHAGDFKWIEPYYDKLCLAIRYRESVQRDGQSGLYFWQNGVQSGADNNVALNYYKDDPRSFLACDASAMQMREYIAQSIIARELGKTEDAEAFAADAEDLRQRILDTLWCEEDQSFYNVNRETRTFYRRVSYSNFWPVVAGVASDGQAHAMIDRYLVNPEHMKSEYGHRTVSKQDPDYNNINMIKPFSNWQGPVWPVAEFIYSVALRNYGYDDELRWMAYTLGSRLIRDYKEYGSLHECYDAETGAALSPDDSYVDENGRFVGFVSWNLCAENILEGVCTGRWNLLTLE